jgi:hypothetical protein
LFDPLGLGPTEWLTGPDGRAARRRASVDLPAAIFPQIRYKVCT